MEVVRYDHGMFMSFKTGAICDPLIHDRLQTLFANACFSLAASMPPPRLASRHGGSSDRRSHGGGRFPNKRRGFNGRARIDAHMPEKTVDPLKTLQGLLNKLSGANAGKIITQVVSLASLPTNVVVHAVLEQACKQSSYVKQYVYAIKELTQKRSPAEIITLLDQYISDFQALPFFMVDGHAEKESYDDFCLRVKTTSQSMGKHKCVLELLDVFETAYTKAGFVKWYMDSWTHVLRISDHNKRDMCAELFLDGYDYILKTKAADAHTSTNYISFLKEGIVQHNMPLKLKFKIMDMEDLEMASNYQHTKFTSNYTHREKIEKAGL